VRRAVLLLAFTIPKAYELRKDEIDHMFHKAQHHGKVRSEVLVFPRGLPVRSSLHFVRVLDVAPQRAIVTLRVLSELRTPRQTAEWPRPCMRDAQQNYNKYVEPYLNKIPRASTSTTSTPGRRTGTAYDSTAESSGMGQPNTGMGQSHTGLGQSNTGMGQPQGGMGQSNMGMGQSHTGMGQSNMGMGQPQGGMGQSNMGMGQGNLGQSNMGMGQGGLGQSNMGMGQGGMGQSSMPMGQSQGGGVDPNGGFTVTHTTTTKKAL